MKINSWKIATSVAFLLFIFSSGGLEAQEEFLEEGVASLLFDEINELRLSKGLQPFQKDEILNAAAFDQAEYILKLGKISHEQEQDKKKTLIDRILYYGGLHAEAGENAVVVGIGSKEQIEPSGSKVTINSEENAVKASITSWLKEEDGNLNLLDKNFYRLGVSVIIDEKKEIIFVAVMASQPYQSPNAKKPAINFYGIEGYSDAECKKFLEEHPSLPLLFSDALKVENNEVFFEYHSLAFVEELIGNSSDGIALDIVQNNQFNCQEGNRLFPTEINKGYLLPPAKKAKFNAYNLARDKGEVKVSLGQLPDFYDKSNCELNAIVIKKGHYCETIPFNNLQTENLHWLEVPYLLAGEKDTNIFSWQDSSLIQFPIKDDSDWKNDLKQQLQFLKELDYQFEEIEVSILFSPIDEEGNISEELHSLLEQEQVSSQLEIKRKVAWKEYFEFQKGTFHQLETDGKDTVEIRDYLKAQTDPDLTTFLKGLNRLELKLKGIATISSKTSAEAKINLLNRLVSSQKIDAALFLQSDLIKLAIDKKIEANRIPITDPSQKENTLPFINNQIVLKQQLGNTIYDGNPNYLAFLELYLINSSETEITFNKYTSELHHWSNNFKAISDLKSWETGFRTLASKVPPIHYARVFLNYQLIAADYYYEKNRFMDRKKAFLEIMKWQKKAELSEAEVLSLAKYFCHQDQLSKAIELLLPYVKVEQVNEKLFSYFLQISIYDKELVSEKYFMSSLEKFLQLFPNSFCELLTKKKLGVQLLGNLSIKELYCLNCTNP